MNMLSVGLSFSVRCANCKKTTIIPNVPSKDSNVKFGCSQCGFIGDLTLNESSRRQLDTAVRLFNREFGAKIGACSDGCDCSTRTETEHHISDYVSPEH